VVRVRVDPPRRGLGAASVFEFRHPYGDQIEELADVEHHAQDGRAHHEVGEHRLLGGPGYVAVHHIGTGLDIALHLPGQPEAVVDVVQQVEEGDLEGGLDQEAQQISPPQAAALLARVVVQPRVVAVLGPVLALALLPVGHVQHHHEGRAGDEDELQGPEADVGDGEEVVVADVGATRLPGVAVELALVVAPDPLGGHHVDQHPEDEDHRQPDAAEGGGVLVDSAKEILEELPIHEVSFGRLLVDFRNCRVRREQKREFTPKIKKMHISPLNCSAVYQSRFLTVGDIVRRGFRTLGLWCSKIQYD